MGQKLTKMVTIAIFLFTIIVFVISCHSVQPYGAEDESQGPTGIAAIFANYGTWLWLIIIWVIPMVLSIVYGRRRNLPSYGLWFLLCFFTGWLGYIIEIIYTNIRSRELERSRHIIQEEILKKSKSQSDSPKISSDTNEQNEKTKEPSPKKTKYCMNCGEELPAEAEFCRKCGKKTG